MAREINLVPDIKEAAIKAIKIRNLTIFASIVVAIGSVVATLVFAGIAGGQQAIVDSKQNTIKTLSDKVKSYEDLDKYLTIKNQLAGLSSIADNKNVLSRLFNVLSALIPTGRDTIKISELTINLEEEPFNITFDAQADAGEPPLYDYRVLNAFNKSLPYIRYDYGNYVDKEGIEIPAYCMIEYNADGTNFKDSDKGIFAYWLINGEGCNPSYEPEEDEDGNIINADDVIKGYEDEIEEYEGEKVVRIWRTPQFKEWYKEDLDDENSHMDTDGTIYDVQHFESSCTTYKGVTNYINTGNASETVYATIDDITWIGVNDNCKLVDIEDDGEDHSVVSESSNGRNANNELVLRFTASIDLNPAVFSFDNEHMIVLGPSSRFNVTDSFVQIQNMFAERAKDCAIDDTACNDEANRRGGENG